MKISPAGYAKSAATTLGPSSANSATSRASAVRDIGRFKMPVLLMEGEQSPPLFKRMRAAVQQCLPSAGLVTIPKAGHQMHQMNAAAFNAELAKFLAE